MILIDAVPNGRTMIGRLGENDHRGVRFPSAATLALCPDASVTVLHKRPGDPAAYPVDPSHVRIEDGRVIWEIKSSDLSAEGTGTAELVYTQGEVIAKTEYYMTQILPALDGSGTPPEPWEGWIAELLEAANHQPKIEDGYWWTWDVEQEEYVNTGEKAAGTDGQDGQDGVSPTVTIESITGGHRITIVDADGTHTADIMDGTDGQDGTDGSDGTDGVSPTVSISDITGGHRVTITDATGDHSFDVMDGTTPTVPVTDVQVNGTSIVSDGVANISLPKTENVSGTTPTITGVADTRYICGEVATLDIVVPASGCIDVIFESGSPATTLTVTSAKTGVTAVKWTGGFDPTSLDANTTYEVNILDGEFGVVGSWT